MTTLQTIIKKMNGFRLWSMLALMSVSLSNNLSAQCTMGCQGNVNISISEFCQDTLAAPYFLQQSYDCTGPMDVSAVDMTTGLAVPQHYGPGADYLGDYYQLIVNSTHVGHTLKVTVKDRSSGNSCWSLAKVEDKIAPVLTCEDRWLSCADTLPSALVTLPKYKDCSNVTWKHFDHAAVDLGCKDAPISGVLVSYYIKRTYTFTDASGNISTCDQYIYFIRDPFLSGVVSDYEGFPEDTVLRCNAKFLTVPSTDGYLHPHPSVSGSPKIKGTSLWPNGANYCEINATFSDQVALGCAPSTYKIIRTWTVADWCTGEIFTRMQLIKIADMDPPTVICPADATVSTTSSSCYANYMLPIPNVKTSCNSPYEISVYAEKGELVYGDKLDLNNPSRNILANLPIGVYNIRYVIENKCNGLKTECTFVLNVKDQIVPTVVCDELTRVALPTDGIAFVDAFTFDDGSHDNCQIVEYKVRRLESCTGTLSQDSLKNPFEKFAKFTCCDVNDTVMVEMRVRDLSGNFNSCMVKVIVEDKLPPLVVCPPNVTVSCGAYDLNNAVGEGYLNTYFGKIDTKSNKRDSVLVNIAYDGTKNRVYVGLDGYATDNCTVNVTQKIIADLSNCNTGKIYREFTAEDNGKRRTTCTQVITVVNEKPFYITPGSYTSKGNITVKDDGIDSDPNDGIVWPDEEIEVSGCNSNGEVDTALTGRPRIAEDFCALVAMTYEDLVLPIQAPACFKVLRKWTVIDWCQYNSGNYTGIWTYNQVIKVLNHVAPTIETQCKDTTICLYPVSCTPPSSSLSIAGKDDCTPTSSLRYSWKLDINDNSTIDLVGNGSTATFNSTTQNVVPFGKHRITWAVEDGCGNVKTCSYSVTLKDCKKPTPICFHGLATDLMPATGMVMLEATKFNNGSFDNCTTNLKFRLAKPNQYPTSRPDTLPTVQAFDCTELGAQIVALWVGDEDGNWDYCETFVLVQNNMGANCSNSTANITGLIRTEMGQEIESVKVSLQGTSSVPYTTSSNGMFMLNPPTVGQSYTVNPVKDVNPTNGVSTQDLVMINKHILGIAPLTSAYKIIAADANKDSKVTTGDMVELRKLILQVKDKLSYNTSWRFIDQSFSFPDPTNPFATAFPETATFTNLTSAKQVNFIGLKVGDVSGNASPNSLIQGEERNGGTWTLSCNDQDVKAGELVEATILAPEQSDVNAYQFTFQFDNQSLQFENIVPSKENGMSIDNFGLPFIERGSITTSWNNTQPATGNLFTVKFKALRSGKLSDMVGIGSAITPAEAYNANENTMNVALVFGKDAQAGKTELYQNQPNPFQNKTTISFNLAQAGTAKVKVLDINGRLLKLIESQFVKGYNEVSIFSSELGSSGVLYYQLETPEITITKKMIVLE